MILGHVVVGAEAETPDLVLEAGKAGRRGSGLAFSPWTRAVLLIEDDSATAQSIELMLKAVPQGRIGGAHPRHRAALQRSTMT